MGSRSPQHHSRPTAVTVATESDLVHTVSRDNRDPSQPRRVFPEEIPDSQSDQGLESFSTNSVAGAFFDQAKFAIEGGSQITKKKYTLHKDGTNVNGRLPIEDKRYTYTEDMDEGATQPLTQPHFDRGRNGSMNAKDESDVICILHPTTIAACRVVDSVSSNAPQHILQNADLSRILEEDTLHDTRASPTEADNAGQGIDGQQSLSNSEDELPDGEARFEGPHGREIALRLSSRVYDPIQGFVFGRDIRKCDIVLGLNSDQMKISHRHFRIYLTQGGILMLEDSSTNGTWVDDVLLKYKHRAPQESCSHILGHGSMITILSSNGQEHLKFVVGIPSRERGGAKYEEKLRDYLGLVAQAERQVAEVRKVKENGNDLTIPPITTNPIRNAVLPRNFPPTRFTVSLAAGTARFHHGMHWSGGDIYSVIGFAGKGAFATVYKVATMKEGTVYAAKELEKRKYLKDGSLKLKFNNELKIMKLVHHPHIVEYIDHHDMQDYLYIIMEYVPMGDVSNYISCETFIAEPLGQSLARQMCHALYYLHKCGITHRDIKPENILIANDDPYTFKLSDFGLSKEVLEGQTQMKTFCGTLLYCAPEIHPGYTRLVRGQPPRRRRTTEPPPTTNPYNCAVDVWSLGAVLYHVLTTKAPYNGYNDSTGQRMLESIMTTELPLGPLRLAGISVEGVQFLSMMLQNDPKERTTIAQCLDQAWIKNTKDVFDMSVLEEAMSQDLENIHEETASQLSQQFNLQGNLYGESIDEEDEDELEVEELIRGRQLQPFDASVDPHVREQQPIPSSDGIAYPELPTADRDVNTPPHHPAPNRLYGEIAPSALQSSGVLGYDTRVALQIPLEGSHDTEVGGSYDQSDDFTDEFDDPLTASYFAQHQLHYRSPIPPPHLPGFAPSLQGAETQIGLLNMASPDSGSSLQSVPTTSVAPDTPRSRPVSQAVSFAGTKRPSQASLLGSFSDEETPKHNDKKLKRSHANHEPTETTNTKEAITLTAASSTRNSSRTGVPGPSGAGLSANIGTSNEVGRPDNTINEARTIDLQGTNILNRVVEKPETTKPQAGATSNQATNTSHSGIFAKPPRRFGKLTTVPGSSITTSFTLTKRDTSWGRDTQCTVIWPDSKESRIPRIAFHISFHRPNIENEVSKEGLDWLTVPETDLCTVIRTPSSRGIWINGVHLRREPQDKDAWFFGRLANGDVITVIDKPEYKVRFAVEIWYGMGKEGRKEGEGFVEEKEVYWLQKTKEGFVGVGGTIVGSGGLGTRGEGEGSVKA